MRIKSHCKTNNIQDCLFISVSEDANARVWKYNNLQQVIKHPNSLWDVDIQYENGHYKLITACSDGVRYVG